MESSITKSAPKSPGRKKNRAPAKVPSPASKLKSINAVARARACVVGLEVSGSLLGAKHAFSLDGRDFEVQIPQPVLNGDFEPPENWGHLLRRKSWKSKDPTLETTSYSIEGVLLTAKVVEAVAVPAGMLKEPPKRRDMAGDDLAGELENLIGDYEHRLDQAAEHWQQVVRWISGSSALGVPGISIGHGGAVELQHVRLENAADGHSLWAPSVVVTVGRGCHLDLPTWIAIGAALSDGLRAPIWWRYLDEAFHKQVSGDLQGAILSGAIACETLAREIFWLASGATSIVEARDMIDKIPIGGVLDRWHKLTGVSKSDAALTSISRLFTLRNRVMHGGGEGASFERAHVRELVKATRQFVEAGDTWLHRHHGTTDPRYRSP